MSLKNKDLEREISRLSALDDPVRRRIYRIVQADRGDMSRDDVSRAAGITRRLAAFHLEKLAGAGLLEVSFRRLSGRTGPGAGRTSKLYRIGEAVDISLPVRRYELAAHVLAESLARDDDAGRSRALRESAHAWGRRVAREESPDRDTAPTDRARRVWRTLADFGFEPRRQSPGEVVLGNCPFDSLAAGDRATICGMNLALVEGMLAGVGAIDIRAELIPRPGHCCVTLRGPMGTDEPGPPAEE